MAADFTIRKGDTRVPISTTITNPDGTVPNLASATVAFTMRDQLTKTRVLGGPAVFVNIGLGQVQYLWQPADTAVSGWYNGGFIVTFPDGTVETFPNDHYIQVYVTPSI